MTAWSGATFAGRSTRLALALLASLAAAPITHADPAPESPRSDHPPAGLSIGALVGWDQPGTKFADELGEASPRAAWGAQALWDRSRVACGVRLWSARDLQWIDDERAVALRRTSVELVGQVHVLRAAGTRISALASAGRLHLGYDPAEIEISTGSGTTTVELRGSDAWIGGAGIALLRPLGEGWSVGTEIEHRWFGLDTAHRQGDPVVQTRQTFGDWNARLALNRTWHASASRSRS